MLTHLQLDMSLAVEVSRTAFQASLLYHSSYISHNHAKRIAETVHHLLCAFLHDPHQLLGSVCGPSRQDLDTIWQWNERCVSPAEDCVHHILESSMEAHAHREAVFSWDGVLSYGELDRLSGALARYLREVHHVGPEVAVALLFEKSCWCVVAQVAVLRCGGYFVTLQPSWPEDRVSKILSEVDARALLHSWEVKPKVSRLMKQRSKSEAFEHMVAIQVNRELVEAMAGAADNRPEEPGSCRGRALGRASTPDDTAYVIYTCEFTSFPHVLTLTFPMLIHPEPRKPVPREGQKASR